MHRKEGFQGLTYRRTTVASESDLEGLAHRLALIASATSDADTGRRLLGLVEELLEQAGLPVSSNPPHAPPTAVP